MATIRSRLRRLAAFSVVALVSLRISRGGEPAPAASPPQIPSSSSQIIPPYTLPDPLICEDGTPVDSVQRWREKRRPELLRMFEHEQYGRTKLARPAAMTFVLREENKHARGGLATRLRVGVLFEGTEQGRQMELLIYLPNQVKGKVPLFFGLNFDGNYTITTEPDLPLPRHFAMGLVSNRLTNNVPSSAARGIHESMWPIDLVLQRGYGLATAAYGEIEPDADGRWREGPRGLAAEPTASDWGSIGAWAWACSRAMDYFSTQERIDSQRVALCGFSRLGKTALWAAAQDERFALVVSNNSGAGGAALHKRIAGETTANLAGKLARWFCGNFRQYAHNESALPIDQHQLLALIAPRPLLIVSGKEDLWSDPEGEFLSARAASSVYGLLGCDGLASADWPAAGRLLDSRIGYFMHTGKHEVTLEDWQAMLRFSDKQMRRKPIE